MEENNTTKQKICPNCGEPLTPEQDICPVCGLGYAAYMEVKSNPKAELAKLYELVESYDGWSTPEEKKERRREERRKAKEERREKREELYSNFTEKEKKIMDIGNAYDTCKGMTLLGIIILLFLGIGVLTYETSGILRFFWWIIIGGGGGIGVIMLSIITIGGIGHGIIVLVDKNKEIPEITKAKQRIKEIEATGVTYNYQRPKPKEEVKPPKSVSKKEKPITGEYKGEVRFEGKNERNASLIGSILLTVIGLVVCTICIYIWGKEFMLLRQYGVFKRFVYSFPPIEYLSDFESFISILIFSVVFFGSIALLIAFQIPYISNKIAEIYACSQIVVALSLITGGYLVSTFNAGNMVLLRYYWLYAILYSVVGILKTAVRALPFHKTMVELERKRCNIYKQIYHH